MTNFPSALDALVNPTPTSGMNAVSHSAQHTNANDAIEALQAKVGIDGSADTDSLDYKINNLGLGTASQLNSVDEDNMASDSAVLLPTQQSVKAYIDAQIAAINVEAFAVGAIYTNVTGVNPATELGYGTWVAHATGRFLVGYDSGDTDFDTAEEEGGSKTHTITDAQMPSHLHTVDPPNTNTGTQSANHNHNYIYPFSPITVQAINGADTALGHVPSRGTTTSGSNNQSHYHAVNIPQFNSGTTGSDEAMPIVPPYSVVHFWKRTA